MQVMRDMSVIDLENNESMQYISQTEFQNEEEHEPEQTPQFSMGGGDNIYNYIINPRTNRKVKIDSKLGTEIIKKYIKYQNK